MYLIVQAILIYKTAKSSPKFYIKFHVVRAASLCELLHVQTDSLHNHPGHLKEKIITLNQSTPWDGGYLVGVTVAGGSPVLQVSISLLSHVPRDADAAAPA